LRLRLLLGGVSCCAAPAVAVAISPRRTAGKQKHRRRDNDTKRSKNRFFIKPSDELNIGEYLYLLQNENHKISFKLYLKKR
jgi:hypothetical protein